MIRSMGDPRGAETSVTSDVRKGETCDIMTINMKCVGQRPADEQKELIISTINGSSASVIFCQNALGNFKTKVVEKCGNHGSSYQFVPKNIRSRKTEAKVAVMWCETKFEGKEIELTEPSITKIEEALKQEKSVVDVSTVRHTAIVKLTSRGTTKASFLAVSWHRPENASEASKAFYGLICFVGEVCRNEKLSWFIMGGDFNFNTSEVDLIELKGLVTISRGLSFVLCKVTFAVDITCTVSEVEPLESKKGSSKAPQLKHVPVVAVLKLLQDKGKLEQYFQSCTFRPTFLYITKL